ncbi:MAG: archaellin/type IV pilin N-terminal domain-containing protein [Conexivisphaerales archaeon]
MTTYITRKRKAVSPVIATVILIAVAVALGIAVAFWASGLTSSFSKYEKLGVNTQYATLVSCPTGSSNLKAPCWTINLGGQNTGSSDATITQIQVNGVPIDAGKATLTSAPSNTGSNGAISIAVPSGSTFTVTFTLDSSGYAVNSAHSFNDGQTIQVTIITAAGNNYPASIVLP